jgi:hypothetical protein
MILENTAAAGAIVLSAVIVVPHFVFTPSMWFEAVAFDVPDVSLLTADTPIAYDRIIRRDFDGRWQIEVHREVEGGLQFVCATDWHDVPYKAGSVLPDLVTWGWMLDGDATCMHLPPGQYEASVTWQINIHSGFLRREVSRTDRFTIVEAALK